MFACVPDLDQVAAVSRPEHRDGGRIEREARAGGRRKVQKGKRQRPDEVAVAEDEDVAVPQVEPGQEVTGTTEYGGRRFAARAAVVPELPARPLGAYLLGGYALVVAVIPLGQERIDDRRTEAGQPGGVTGAPQRARVDGRELLLAQPPAERPRPLLTLREKGQVCPGCVFAACRPFGLAVASQEDVDRRSPAHQLGPPRPEAAAGGLDHGARPIPLAGVYTDEADRRLQVVLPERCVDRFQ